MEMVHVAMYLADWKGDRLAGPAVLAHAQMWDRQQWESEYGERAPGLLIGLPDTFGSEGYLNRWAAFEADSHAGAVRWAGLRQDSGDPFAVGELFEKFWRGCGVDPATKLTMFSDSLDLGKCISLDLHFGDRLNKVFGIGTDLTNDVGLKAPSMVVKPCAVLVGSDWHPCVKLSDDMAKATGDRTSVERYKAILGRG
jgi:nicotinate phosphoribosyltransferase